MQSRTAFAFENFHAVFAPEKLNNFASDLYQTNKTLCLVQQIDDELVWNCCTEECNKFEALQNPKSTITIFAKLYSKTGNSIKEPITRLYLLSYKNMIMPQS